MKNTYILDGMAEELTSIIMTKTANVGGGLPTPNYGGGAKPFLGDSLKRGWQQGGGFGKAMTGVGVGLSLPGALAEQDPSGQGKSRPERLAEVGGATMGGLVGGGAMSNLGNMITRKIDPTDHFLTDASHQLDTKKFSPKLNAQGNVRTVQMPPTESRIFGTQPGGRAPMNAAAMKGIAERQLDRQVRGRAGTLLTKAEGQIIPRLNTGNLANYAKFKGGRAALNFIPGALGVAGSVLGMGLGEKLMGLPFRGLRSNPQEQQQVPPEAAPVS